MIPAIVPEAAVLVSTDPYAFLIGVCLDRGAKVEIIWTIPYYIQQELGHLDPRQIIELSLEKLADPFAKLPKRPRYVNAAPKTLQQLTKVVIEDFEGDGSKLWTDKRAVEVHGILRSIYGVGPGIASMGVLLIESTFGIQFEDKNSMDIKPDVHTMRVLYCLGVSNDQTEASAIVATRIMNPEFPGALDGLFGGLAENGAVQPILLVKIVQWISIVRKGNKLNFVQFAFKKIEFSCILKLSTIAMRAEMAKTMKSIFL